MSGLFGGGEADKSQRRQQRYAAQAIDSAQDQINTKKILELIKQARPTLATGVSDAQAQAAQTIAGAQGDIAKYLGAGSGLISSERDRLASIATQLSGGLKPVDYQGPGYGIKINNDGTIAMNRTGETQGFIDKLLSGMAGSDAAYGDLLSQITPGFGRLTEARKTDIENQARAATGNLREQLARRRVLGASFAEDQVRGLQAQYDQMRDQAIAESMVEELKMTGDVITARTNAWQQAIADGLSQLQFEGNIGAQLTTQVSASLQQLQAMQIDVAKLSAALTEMGVNLNQTGMTVGADLSKFGAGLNTDLAKLGIAGNVDLTSLGAQLMSAGQLGKANVGGNLSGQVISSFPSYAELASQEAAGPMELVGLLGGSLLTGGAGSFGSKLGNAIFGGK